MLRQSSARTGLYALLGSQAASHSTNGQLHGLNSSEAVASHSDVAAGGGVARVRGGGMFFS
jgi:hypothetical protein